ncbi:MAG: hypothetical protein OES90_04920 [Xanthomonadales bacterium]|nr:hypothetical protein [Xanthomonadales bacterium]
MKTYNQIAKQTIPILVFLFFTSTGFAEVEKRAVFEPVHWAYSSFFGTGWYKVDDARSVFVLRTPIRQTLRKSSLEGTGSERLGIEIRYPLTVGLHDIEDLGGIIDNDNFATATFAPGIELEIPINERWYLRTLAHVGWGSDLRNDDSAWIYYAGIKSRYIFPAEKYQWSLLNGLFYAGYTPDEGRSDHLAVAQIGAELRQPLSRATIRGEPVDLHWTIMYSFLGNELHFNLPDGTFEPIEDQIEFGLQMSFRSRPFKIWFLDVHRIGLGYKFSPDGQFTAITFSMNSWFRK